MQSSARNGGRKTQEALPLSRLFLFALMLLALAPVLVPYVSPQDDSLFLYPYSALLDLLSIVLCLRLATQRTGVAQLQWALATAHFACVGMVYLVADAQLLGVFPALHGWLPSTFSVAAKMLTLLALTAADGLGSPRIRVLDAILALTLPVLQFIGSYSGTYASYIPKHLYLNFLLTVLLALVATAAHFASGSHSRGSFSYVMVVFLWSDVLNDLVTNLLNNEWLPAPRVVPFNMLFGASSLLFCFLAHRAQAYADDPRTTPRRPWTHSFLPGVLVVTGVVLASLVLREHPFAAGVYLFVLVSAYTLRTHLLYRRLMEKQKELRSHAGHLERLATRDALTGIGNRRSLEEAAAAFLTRTPPTPVALILADTDHFKRINDAFGHSVGDEVLRLVAESLCVEAEKVHQAACARLGGDEFVALLPNTDGDTAEALALHAGRRMQQESIHENLQATISVGIAVSRGEWTLPLLLKEADGALYQAKSQGRNRVVMAEDVRHSAVPGD